MFIEYYTVLTMQVSSKITQLSVCGFGPITVIYSIIGLFLKLPGIVMQPQFLEIWFNNCKGIAVILLSIQK